MSTPKSKRMQRYTLYLEKDQLESLTKQSAKTGAPVSELIRRAVAASLKAQSK